MFDWDLLIFSVVYSIVIMSESMQEGTGALPESYILITRQRDRDRHRDRETVREGERQGEWMISGLVMGF